MMASIEETIQSVERLYHSMTGHEAPQSNGEPYSPIPPETDAARHVEQQLADLVQRVHEAFGARPEPSFSPPVTIRDEPGERIFEFDVPGVLRETLSVVIRNDLLTVSGQRALAPPAEGAGRVNLVHNERAFGGFERTLPLPDGVTGQKITAELREGVLRVRVPRAGGQGEPRSVPVT